jgi:uncharacterized protein YqgC (DUF456 family)
MSIDSQAVVSSLALLLIFLGLVGAVIPVLPGPILIFIGALLFAYNDGFARIGAPTLIVLGVLTVMAWGSELALTTTFTRRAGATWRTVGGAVVGGLVGGLLLNTVIPLVGALIGAASGAVLGVIAVERGLNRREWPEAWRISRTYLAGCLVGRVVEMSLCIVMIAIFAFQAFA